MSHRDKGRFSDVLSCLYLQNGEITMRRVVFVAIRDDLTKDKFEKLFHDQNMRFSGIAKMYGCSPAFITRLAKEYDIKAKSSGDWRTNANQFTKELLYQLYITDGKSTAAIGKEIGVSTNSVVYMLDKYEIPRRSKLEGIRLQKSQNLTINIDFFRNDSPEKFYVIGLIASDGCISGNFAKLVSKDRELVDYLKTVTECINPVREDYREVNGTIQKYYGLHFSSVEMVEILNTYGITERKSLTFSSKNVPQKYLCDFIRGVFDGDGSLSVSRRKDNGARTQKFGIVSASEEFAKELHFIFSEVVGVSVNKIVRDKRGNGIYNICVGKRGDVIRLGEWMYGKDFSKFGLKRKKDKFNILREWASA
jgi:intein-encoded DNA endonuclease-like protein